MDSRAQAKAKPLPVIAAVLGVKVRRSGSVPLCCCPWHAEANPSCALYPDHAYCFSCRRAGDAIDFVQAYASVDFREAIRMINDEVIAAPAALERPKKERVKISAPDLKTAVTTYTASLVRDGYKLTALHCYRRPDGKPHFWKARLEHPERGKTIWPIYRADATTFVIGQPDGIKPLYNADLLLKHPSPTVWFVEGEKCADILCKHRKLATTTGSATSASSFDFSSLAHRKLIVWPDADCPGQEYAWRIIRILKTLPVSHIWLVQPETLGLSDGADAADWIARGLPIRDVLNTAYEVPEEDFSCLSN